MRVRLDGAPSRVDGRPGRRVRLEELGVDGVREPVRQQLERVVGCRIRVERGKVLGEHRERAEPFPPGGGGGARGRREGPIHAANLVPHCAPVAQWIERFPPEEEVARSSRVGGTVTRAVRFGPLFSSSPSSLFGARRAQPA